MKDTFKKIYQEHIQRKGADKLLTWLEGSDFFTAPASTRFHGAHEGGLVEHSVHVYQRLKAMCEAERAFNHRFEMPSEETVAIVGLLHDLCKVNFYSVEMRNRKNDRGVWDTPDTASPEDGPKTDAQEEQENKPHTRSRGTRKSGTPRPGTDK